MRAVGENVVIIIRVKKKMGMAAYEPVRAWRAAVEARLANADHVRYRTCARTGLRSCTVSCRDSILEHLR